MKFRTTILQGGKTATGIEVPESVMDGARRRSQSAGPGDDRRLHVSVLGRHRGRQVDGRGQRRASRRAGVAGGDEVDVNIELDTEPRTVTVPDELAAALDADPQARATFDRLSYSNRSWHVLQVTGAKTEETRQRRIARSIEVLHEGRPR